MQTRSLTDYKTLFGFNKPCQLFLILLQVAWVLWIASTGLPSPLMFFVFIGGAIITYAFCNAFSSQNTLFSKKQIRNYLALFSITLIVLLAMTSWLTWIFAATGLILAFCYFLTKKNTFWKAVLLGFSTAWFVPLIFSDAKQMVPHISWILYLTVAFWTITARYFQSSITTKTQDNLLYTALLQAASFILLIVSGVIYGQGLFYFIALLMVLLAFAFQLRSLCKKQISSSSWICSSYTWIAGLIFLATLINYHY